MHGGEGAAAEIAEADVVTQGDVDETNAEAGAANPGNAEAVSRLAAICH